MVEQIALSTNKIHEEDSLAVLNHSTKRAMSERLFPQRILSIAFYQQEVKLKFLSQLEEVLMKFIKKNF